LKAITYHHLLLKIWACSTIQGCTTIKINDKNKVICTQIVMDWATSQICTTNRVNMVTTVSVDLLAICSKKWCWHHFNLATQVIKINLANTWIKMETHEVASCVTGFHVYGDNWISSVGEILICKRKSRNPSDSYAVAIKKGGRRCQQLVYYFTIQRSIALWNNWLPLPIFIWSTTGRVRDPM